jgi:hypothetical protein
VTLAHHIPVESLFVVTCPYCGEDVEIYLEPEIRGSLVQDCEVCCNPWNLYVSPADGVGFSSSTCQPDRNAVELSGRFFLTKARILR